MTGSWQLLPGQTIPDLTDVPRQTVDPKGEALLVGRKVRVHWNADHTARVFLNDRLGISALRLQNAPPLTRVVTPVSLEHSFAQGLYERAFVPLHQAAAIWNWTTAANCTLTLTLELLPSAGSVVVHGRTLSTGDVIVACDRDCQWEIGESWARLTGRLPAGEALTLVAADSSALGSLAQVSALVLSRVADWRRTRSQLLHVDCSDAAFAAALNHAVYQLYSIGRMMDAELPAELEPARESVSTFLRAVLRFRPDPEKQRAVIAPHLPSNWTGLEVRNLRLGDDRIGLRYQRSGNAHSFALVPESGAVPPRIVFEPAIAAQNITGVSVDGVTAELDLRRQAERIVCPLQVVLDHERIIVIDAVQG